MIFFYQKKVSKGKRRLNRMENAVTTIYDELGGKSAFLQFTDYFYGLILSDPSLKNYFYGRDTNALRQHQAQFLASLAGGPAFRGKPLDVAHNGLNISEEDYTRVEEHLLATLEHFQVNSEIKDFFMNLVSNLKEKIVGK